VCRSARMFAVQPLQFATFGSFVSEPVNCHHRIQLIQAFCSERAVATVPAQAVATAFGVHYGLAMGSICKLGSEAA
jgi:hypothetical protein